MAVMNFRSLVLILAAVPVWAKTQQFLGNSTLKLHYFDLPVRGEGIRWAMVIGDIPFEDNRIAFSDWPTLKENADIFAYGTAPALELRDGTNLAQTTAILKYVGQLAQLYPKDAFRAAKVDEVVSFLQDVFNAVIPVYFGVALYGKDEATKKAEEKELDENKLPYMFSKLEGVIANYGKDGYAIGETLTIADIQLAVVVRLILDGSMNISQDLLKDFPKVQASVDKVMENPKLAAYLQKK